MRLIGPLALLLALVASGCGGDGEGAAETTAAPPASSASGCEPATAAPKPDGTLAAPKKRLEAGKTYRLIFVTNCGSFTVTLDQELAPKTTASLVHLAEQDFFDDTFFHRIVPGFVIQGGDPTGSGTGGPGYKTVDPPPATATYTLGVVAMAKAGNEPPGTSGSQFFVVTAEDAGLPPEYAVVGEVTDGIEVVERIGTLGDAAEQPTETVVIRDVAVETS